ncbi:MAG: hypothetical protein AB1744_14375, partial [Candidatus Zixiibacteriota bacterium]
AAPEMMILIAGVLISVTAMLYLGTTSNETVVAVRAVRDGAENAVAAIDTSYGSSIDIASVSFEAGTATIRVSVSVRNAPPDNMTWENFRENIVKYRIKVDALEFIRDEVGGRLTSENGPVTTALYSYIVNVDAVRVTK